MKKWIIISCVDLSLAVVASAQTLAETMPVYVDCKRDTVDIIGMGFCAHLGTEFLLCSRQGGCQPTRKDGGGLRQAHEGIHRKVREAKGMILLK
jgi:hypothetical protein